MKKKNEESSFSHLILTKKLKNKLVNPSNRKLLCLFKATQQYNE